MTKFEVFPGLRILREAAGFTVTGAAKEIGKTESHLSKIERGHTGLRASDAVALARLYGVTVDRLLS